MAYFDLDRKFIKRITYDASELIVTHVKGELLDWSHVLENQVAVIVAPANFGKSTEMEHRAAQLCAGNDVAIFVALRHLAESRVLERALTEPHRANYKSWKSTSSGKLTLFVDSLDEAASWKRENIEHLLGDIADAVSWPNERVNWVISTRPAVLTPDVIDKLSALLSGPASTVQILPSTSQNDSGTITSDVTPINEPARLQVFSMYPLDGGRAKVYLKEKHSCDAGAEILRAARERGLSGFTESPGGLDILASIDLLVKPPDSLTEVFNRVVGAVQMLRGADPRLKDVGGISPELLGEAAKRLASASQVCQLVNIEMPAETLDIPKSALSARLIVTPMLNEAAINQLLNSQLFVDVGLHQVKIYPDELVPFLAAKRLAGLVQSLDQAFRLLEYFRWAAPSGEQGVHRQFLPLMGWLATLNPHCRAVILKHDPQALAFFGDLRNSAVPLADAKQALTESIRRLVQYGDTPGRGMYFLTSENYWQAGPERMESVIGSLFDDYGEHYEVRKALLNISSASRLQILRAKVLLQSDNTYSKLLEDDLGLRYILDLGLRDDLASLADAIKSTPPAQDELVGLLLRELGWEYFTPGEVARLVDSQFVGGQHGFSVSYAFESGGLLGSASETQLLKLCRAMLIHVTRHLERGSQDNGGSALAIDEYVELVVEAIVSLVRRVSSPNVYKVRRMCLVLQRLLYSRHFHLKDNSLRGALEDNTEVRRALLEMVSNQSRLNNFELLAEVVGYRRACEYKAEDVELVGSHRLKQIYAEYIARPCVEQKKSPPVDITYEDVNLADVISRAKDSLGKIISTLSDGTAVEALLSAANWMLQSNSHTRYGEVNFKKFELEMGDEIADAVRHGLSQVWRSKEPLFDEHKPNTTQSVTVAGLQGLYLELGQGEALPQFFDWEVRRAIRYATFEINGYPKWFWALVKAHPGVAASELRNIAEAAGDGLVSREHAEQLFTSISEAPDSIKEILGPLAWDYLLRLGPSREHVAEQLFAAVMVSPTKASRIDFEKIAMQKMKTAFKSPLPNQLDAQLGRQRSEAVLWASKWLLEFPNGFRNAVSKWRTRDTSAVREFLLQLAAHFGHDRKGALTGLAAASDEGLSVLEDLYCWIRWAVDPNEDIERPVGVVFRPEQRDEAQSFRDSLPGIIASANSQAAYDALGRIGTSEPGAMQLYVKRLQFHLRERQLAKPPLHQSSYDQFEKDFVADVTDSLSFSMAVHSDLEAVKYDIEQGEHSLRRFFSALDFAHVTNGAEGRKAALALEADFQQLLASELNHYSRGRYSVSMESQTAEATRRDVLCSRNDWRASIELKMSQRWTINDYLIALEQQLVGQYMRHNKALTGFLVLVLQTKNRKWKHPKTGKRIRFPELLELLAEEAQRLESLDRSRYLRVIGIDATEPESFRAQAQPGSAGRCRKRKV